MFTFGLVASSTIFTFGFATFESDKKITIVPPV
jgi:hypothetical protein